MLNNGNDYNCGRSDDIVAYIYDEIGPSERQNFETHLAGCWSCTDEFAAVADARFSVFEWHKEEFSHLPTPEFSIPYAAETRSGVGFFAGFREMITGMGWPATVAAAFMVCVGLTFAVMIVINGSQQQQVAQTVVDSEAPSDMPESSLAAAAIPDQPQMDKTAELPEPEPTFTATTTKRSTPGRVRNTRPLKKPSPNPRTRAVPLPTYSSAPVLGSYEDNEDRSLRLSDLMDEVGG